jgi:hypothetical protein
MAAMEIVLLGLMLAALAFGGFAVICVIGRRRRRQALRELLGDAFDEKKSFIQAMRAITVDEAAGRFAFSDSRNTILYKADDIIKIEFLKLELFSPMNVPVWFLMVYTVNPTVPLLELWTFVRDLREIYTRLEAIHARVNRSTDNAGRPSAAQDHALEIAITQLTHAVSGLTNAAKQLTSEIASQRHTHRKQALRIARK